MPPRPAHLDRSRLTPRTRPLPSDSANRETDEGALKAQHRPTLRDLLAGPWREWKTIVQTPGLLAVEARLAAAYLLRFPALFIFLDRRALHRLEFDDESFMFGETPYHVAGAIVRRMQLGPSDVLYDLGCGRGKMVFASHLVSGCTTVGVELLPTYTTIARRIARRFGQKITILETDARKVDLSLATAIYLNAWTFSPDLIDSLYARIDALREDVWWTSVGMRWFHPRLQPVDEQTWWFSWGRATVCFYRVAPHSPTTPSPSPLERDGRLAGNPLRKVERIEQPL